MVDIFARLEKNAGGPIGQYMRVAHGYFAFPKLEGELGPHMRFRGKMMLNWSLNNYLGLANHPEVREADARGAAEFGMAAPMGARMMSGQTKYHEQLERELAAFVGKEDAFLLNFGYQGMISIIDCLLSPRALDVVVYDAEAHACIMDGLRLYKGKRFMYAHNDMESLRLQLKHATELAEQQGGGVLVITEGVFGIRPTGLRSFDLTPRLPAKWERMSLRNIRAFGSCFDVEVARADKGLEVRVTAGDRVVCRRTIRDGRTLHVSLD